MHSSPKNKSKTNTESIRISDLKWRQSISDERQVRERKEQRKKKMKRWRGSEIER